MNPISPAYPMTDLSLQAELRKNLDRDGVVVLPNFLTPQAIEMIKQEGAAKIREAYFCVSHHNVYLTPKDDQLPDEHPKNRQVISSKGLIADDQIDDQSPLKQVYKNADFQRFIANIVGENEIYPYADTLSAVNIHYAKTGQELGWHFDNSSFAITLLIDKPEAGAKFQFVRDLRDADAGDMNYDRVAEVLDGNITPDELTMAPGHLVLFRGRNSMHRVTPTEGDKTRMLAVLAYNSKPGIALSQSARQTFYGRL